MVSPAADAPVLRAARAALSWKSRGEQTEHSDLQRRILRTALWIGIFGAVVQTVVHLANWALWDTPLLDVNRKEPPFPGPTPLLSR